jgi:ankyrin repeat protein
MKKAGLVGVLLGVAVFAYAQDHYPIEDENPEVIKILSEAGVNFEYPKFREYIEPWREAIGVRAPSWVFEDLLALGVKVEPYFNEYIHESPLMTAVQSGYLEAIDFFIKHGADVNREHSLKRTPIHFAALLENSQVLERLIQVGADVNRKDEFGYTALHHAAGNQKIENIKLLLIKHADINAKSNDGSTPLIGLVSSFMAEPSTVQALLEGRPDLNTINAQGQTALITAARNVSKPEIITLLLNAGANAKLEDNTGRTALDWFDQNRRISQSPVRKELRNRM